MTKPNILIVDDRKENLLALEALLDICDATVCRADSGNEALALVLEHSFAVVLLDVQMPGMDGFEVAELMRQNPLTERIPIIFVTAISKEQHYVFKGYDVGAVDYLSKPIDPHTLYSKVNVFLQLWTQKNELSLAIAELENVNRQVLLQQDELRKMAIYDHLTGLYQRRWFDEVARKEESRALRNILPLSIGLIDIDYFKNINDNFGHHVGDAVLIQVAQLIENMVRDDDVVFRYGGEEFVVLMPHTEVDEAMDVCERLCSTVAGTNFFFEGHGHHVTISIGVAELFQIKPPSISGLVECADKLLYQAKDMGRNRVCSNQDKSGIVKDSSVENEQQT